MTLDEVSEKTGLSQAHLRKLIQRGQLRAEKDGNRTNVTDRALVDFLAARALDDAADAVRLGEYDEALRVIRAIPDEVRQMILAPLPRPPMTHKKASNELRDLDGKNDAVYIPPPPPRGIPVVRAVPKPSQKKK